MTVPRLTADQRRALRILADDGRNGVTEALMLAHGFGREMLAGLVLAELAIVVTRTMRAGGRPKDVKRWGKARMPGMCGRLVQRYGWHEVQDRYELAAGPVRNLQVHYGIAPTDFVEVVTLDSDSVLAPIFLLRPRYN